MNTNTSGREPGLHCSIRATAAPMAVYASLYGTTVNTFLCESLESRGQRSRYSFLGGRPRVILRASNSAIGLRSRNETEQFHGDLFEALRTVQRQSPPAPVSRAVCQRRRWLPCLRRGAQHRTIAAGPATTWAYPMPISSCPTK